MSRLPDEGFILCVVIAFCVVFFSLVFVVALTRPGNEPPKDVVACYFDGRFFLPRAGVCRAEDAR